MEIRKVLTLRGPNYWARFPVLEAWVDLGELKDSPSNEIPGFNERLMSWLPTMIEHRCSIGERGGFFERLRRGTYQAHILEHVTLELQELAYKPVGFGRARETSEEGVYKVAVEYLDETLGRECLQTGRELCLAAVYDRPFDIQAAILHLREVARQHCFSPSASAIVDAAEDRGIPVRRLNSNDLVMLGHGVRQRRIQIAESDRTGAIADAIAKDRALTRTLLASVGVPIPQGRAVENAEDAWEAAQELGLPVVVKAQDADKGRGALRSLTTREQILNAYDTAKRRGEAVFVEHFAKGSNYRLLVAGGKVIAAARREPPQVIGDGRSTIAHLVDRINQDPHRGDGFLTPLCKVNLDEPALAALAEQGYALEAIPPQGERVFLGRKRSLSCGGFSIDVTEKLHPEVAARAVEAATVVGLDMAGIDMIAEDLARPLEEQGGVVVEVCSNPGLQMHLPPSAPPQPVGAAIINHLFPGDRDGRIPIACVTGVNGKTTVTRLIAHALRLMGRTVGMTTTDGVYIGERRIEVGDCSGPKSARSVLINPNVEAAVFEVARGGILREGLGFDRCAVSVLTNIGEGDHLGLNYIETLEQLARVKSAVVDAVAPNGTAVLNAIDPHVAPLGETCRGAVAYFALHGDAQVIQAHRAKGGRAAFVRDGRVILAHGEYESKLIELKRVPLTYGGRISFQVENVLAASLACASLEVPAETICRALETFAGGAEQTPGRFNTFEIDGATVVADYGHNPSAVAALVEAVAAFPCQRRLAVFSADGDRQDEVIARQAELLGSAFDVVLLYDEPARRRGRAPGEMVALLRRGLAAAKRVGEIHEVENENRAIQAGLELLRPGDLLLIQIDAVESGLEIIRGRAQSSSQ